MGKGMIDAETILNRAKPLAHQQAPEIQPYGHLVKLPIALAESACKESMENLNQLLADTIALRDLYKKHHWHERANSSARAALISGRRSMARLRVTE
jgi:hypothetical protein